VRTFHSALEAVETYSPAEELFNARRRAVGLVLGPALLLALPLLPLPLSRPAHTMAGILAMVVVLWVTEALPLAVTAMLGPTLAVILQVAPVRDAFTAFADPVIFVFIGGFMLAEGMFVHGVDRRIAFATLSQPWVGSSSGRVMLAFGGVTTVLSMWMSNTATTAMMYPIGLSIVTHLARTGATGARQFALVMMLITSFGRSIGGMATPVGTPPNLIGIGMLEKLVGIDVTFFPVDAHRRADHGHHVRRHAAAVLLRGARGGGPRPRFHAARGRRAEEARAGLARAA
jgi:sodium-dependent dicarboxylate transporter 2/3/5